MSDFLDFDSVTPPEASNEFVDFDAVTPPDSEEFEDLDSVLPPEKMSPSQVVRTAGTRTPKPIKSEGGLETSLMGPQFKAGTANLQAGFYANQGRGRAQELNTVDKVEAGKPVNMMDDPLGLADMPPELREQAKKDAQAALVKNIARTMGYKAEAAGYARNPNADKTIKLLNDQDFGAAWEVIKSDPVGILQQWFVESLPTMVPGLVGGVGAAALAAKGMRVAAGSMAMGTGAFPTEFVASISESLAQSGVNLQDKKAIEAKLRDPKFIEDAGKRAFTRGTVIAGGSALTTPLMTALKPAAGVVGNVAKMAGNIGKEAGLAGVTEAGAQGASGEKLQVGEILAESVGGVPGSVAGTAIQTIADGDRELQRFADEGAAEYARIGQNLQALAERLKKEQEELTAQVNRSIEAAREAATDANADPDAPGRFAPPEGLEAVPPDLPIEGMPPVQELDERADWLEMDAIEPDQQLDLFDQQAAEQEAQEVIQTNIPIQESNAGPSLMDYERGVQLIMQGINEGKNIDDYTGRMEGIYRKLTNDETETFRVIQEMLDTKEASLVEVIDVMIAKSQDKQVLTLLNKLRAASERYEQAGINTSVEIAPHGELQSKFGKGAQAVLDPNVGENKQRITLDDVWGTNSITLAHEGVHAVTTRLIHAAINDSTFKQQFPDLAAVVKDLDRLRVQMQSHLGKLVTDSAADSPMGKAATAHLLQSNMLKNPGELLAWGMTSPSVQMLLRSQKGRNNPTMWGDVKDLYYQVLGIDKQEATSTGLDRVFDAFDLLTQHPYVDVFNPDNGVKDLDFSMFNHSPYPLTQQDVTNARKSYEEQYRIAQALNHDALPPIYTDGHSRLLQAMMDPAHPYGKDMEVMPLTDQTLFYYIGDPKKFQFQANPKQPAPYYLLKYPGNPDLNRKVFEMVVMNVDNRVLFNTIRKQQPDVKLGLVPDALLTMRTGRPVEMAIAPWVSADKAFQAIEQMPRVMKDKLPPDIKVKLADTNELQDIPDHMVALHMALDAPDLMQNATDLMSAGAHTKAMLTQNPIARWLRHAIGNAVSDQVEISRNVVFPLAKLWHGMNLNGRGQAWKALMIGDQMQVTFTDQQLEQEGMSPEAIQFYRLMRETMDFMLDTWNKSRAYGGLEPIPKRPGYMPGTFKGDYKALVTNKDGETVGLVTANTAVRLWQRARALKKQGYQVSSAERQSLRPGKKEAANAFEAVNRIEELLSSEGRAAVDAFKSNYAQILNVEAQRLFGFHVHGKFKKGVFGNMGNEPWFNDQEKMDSMFEGMVKHIEEGTLHHALAITTSQMGDIITDSRMRSEKPKTVRWLQTYFEHITRHPHEAAIDMGILSPVNLVRKLGKGMDFAIDGALEFFGMGPSTLRKANSQLRYTFGTAVMGMGNVSFSVMQLTQIITHAMPKATELRSKYGINVHESRGAALKAGSALSQYFMEKTRGKPMNGLDWMGGDAETRAALRYAEKNNLINFSDIDRAVESTASPVAAKRDQMLNFNQRLTEAMTRPTVFLWFYNLARDGGIPQQLALENAKHATQFVMVDYHSLNRPMIYAQLGVMGAALSQLKTFAHADVANKTYILKGALSLKKSGLAAATTMAAVYMLFLGVKNFPSYDEWDWLLKQFNIGPKDKPKGFHSYMLEHQPEWITHGYLSAHTQIDISGRLKMAPLFDVDRPSNSFTPPSYSWLGEIVKNAKTYYDEPTRRHSQNLWYSMIPSVLKGPAEHWWRKGEHQEVVPLERAGSKETFGPGSAWGLSAKDRKNDVYRSEREWNLRKWGARGLGEAVFKEQTWLGMEMNMHNDNYRKSLEEQIVKKYVNGDPFNSDEVQALGRKYMRVANIEQLEALNRKIVQAFKARTFSTRTGAYGSTPQQFQQRRGAFPPDKKREE